MATHSSYNHIRNDRQDENHYDSSGPGQAAHGAPKFGTMVPNRIFVGGLPSSTGEEELASLFSRWGRVRQAKIIADRACISKGYGFVTFETEEEANRALMECADLIYRDRKLNVAPAIKKQPIGYDGVQSPSPTSTPTMYYPTSGIPLYQNGMQIYNAQTPGSPVGQPMPQASTPQQMSIQSQPQVQQTVVAQVQTDMNPTVAAFYPQQPVSLPTTPQGGYPRQVICSPIFFPPNQPVQYVPANPGTPTWTQPNQWRWVAPGYPAQQPTSPSVGYILVPVPTQQPHTPSNDPPPPSHVSYPDNQTSQNEAGHHQAQNGSHEAYSQLVRIDQGQEPASKDQKKEQQRIDSSAAQAPTLVMATQAHPSGFSQPLTVNTQFGSSNGLLQVQGQPLVQSNQLSTTQMEQRQKLQPLVFQESNQQPQQFQSNCLMLYSAHGQVYVVENGQGAPRWDKTQSISLPSTPMRALDTDSGVDGSAPSEEKSQGSVYTNSPREQFQAPQEQYQYLPFRPELGLSPGFQNFDRRRFGYYRQRRPYRGFYRNNFGRDYYGGFGGYYYPRPRFHPMPMGHQNGQYQNAGSQYQNGSNQYYQNGTGQYEGQNVLTPPYTPGVPPPNVSADELVKQVADLEIKA